MVWARETLYNEWDSYYTASEYMREIGQLELAAQFLTEASLLLLANYGIDEAANYPNLIAVGSILVNEYAAYDQAERLYLGLIEKMPQRWDAYYELAATLQAKNDVPAALELLYHYKAEHGEVTELLEAEEVLMNALRHRKAAQESTTTQP